MLANATSNNEGSLNSGYAVTSNYHGLNVPIGADVVVTAMSTSHLVDKVRFIWKDPAGHVIWDETINVFHNGTTYYDKLVYYAISAHKPEIVGDLF